MKQKWYENIMTALLFVIFLPLILFVVICFGISAPFVELSNRKKYKESQYFKDFKVPYSKTNIQSDKFKFYNLYKEKSFPIQYVRQASNNFEFFIYEGAVYLFPDFNFVKYFPETKEWKCVYRKYSEENYVDVKSYIELKKQLLDKEYSNLHIRIILERNYIEESNLNDKELPIFLYIVRNYKTAFEPIDWKILSIIPQNEIELYNMLQKTPNLRGSFVLTPSNMIQWTSNDLFLEITMDLINVNINGRLIKKNLTHWHPDDWEIYDEVCDITKAENVLVIKKFMGVSKILYIGDKKNCPYEKSHKIYYFE